MSLALDILSWMLLVAGAVAAVIGGIGVIRMPDLYTRMHAASVTDTAGMVLILGGLLLQAPDFLVAVRLLLIVAFLVLTSPAATHALARAALEDGLQPVLAGAKPRKRR